MKTIRDLLSEIIGLRPDAAACGIEIGIEDVRKALQEMEIVARYEDISKEDLGNIADIIIEGMTQ